MTSLSMVLSSLEGHKVAPHVVPHRLLRQGGRQEGIERLSLLRGQFGERQTEVIRHGTFSVERTEKRQRMKRVGIGKRLHRQCPGIDGEGEPKG